MLLDALGAALAHLPRHSTCPPVTYFWLLFFQTPTHVICPSCRFKDAIQSPAFPALFLGTRPFRILLSGRRCGSGLAGLCADPQRFDLGIVGLVQFIPTLVLTFAAGHVADRYDRERVVEICQIAAGSDSGIPGLGQLCRMAERAGAFCHGGGVRRRHRL